MPSDLQTRFAKRMTHFFTTRKINVDTVEGKNMIDYLYTQFEQQGRFKNKEGRFSVTPRFVMDAISNFLIINPTHCIALFRDHRDRRSSATYSCSNPEDAPLHKATRGLIQLLGRKHKPKYKLTKSDGAPLTPARVDRTKAHTLPFDISFSPLAPLGSDEKARKRAVSSDKAHFEQEMVSSKMTLWRMKTPQKDGFFSSPHRVHFSRPTPQEQSKLCKKLDFSSSSSSSSFYSSAPKKESPELFEFRVTQEDILNRIGAKRPISQKRVNGNISAMEMMQAVGVIITEKQNGRNFHWAHRRGWSLHGEQVKENFDPMTAGSNYDTLFKIEAPLKKLLLDDELDDVLVNGEVIFDKDTGLPFKITYRLSWGTSEFIEVVIDPLSHRVPTVDEHKIAKTFFGLTVGSRC